VKSFILIILLGLFSLTLANEAGLVKKVKGSSYIVRNEKKVAINIGTKVFEADTIITKGRSSVGLIFKDNTRITVGSNSEFAIEEYIFDLAEDNIEFKTNLVKGTLACVTGLISKTKPSAFKLKVKTATMGIRGTYFIVNTN
jgi:hypothetical protein